MIDEALALELVLSEADEWPAWRGMRLSGEEVGSVPALPDQDPSGGFIGSGGKVSPGATGEAICHLAIIGLAPDEPARRAADWLEGARTPALAWLDAPDDAPGPLDSAAGARVWATASAACGLFAVGRDPGPRALQLLRGEADMEGRFTGGAYPTFAAAAAYWAAEGPQTEMAEWALRWAREWPEAWWGPWERVTALTFWTAVGIPPEHASVALFFENLREEAPTEGWRDDLELTLRTLELARLLGD